MGSFCSFADDLPTVHTLHKKELKSDEMYINVFLITHCENDYNFDENLYNLYTKCGDNVPQFCVYDGGERAHYLICLDARIDIHKLCPMHNLRIYSEVHLMKIKKSEYSDEYGIRPTYSLTTEEYKLEKVNDIIYVFCHDKKQYIPHHRDKYIYLEKNNPQCAIKCHQ